MPRAAACSKIASTIIVSVCGVLNIQAFFGLIGSMMRADDASEITGVSASATMSIIASVLGVVVEPMIASTLFSMISRRVFATAAAVSLASSSTMYSTSWPAIFFGSSGTVFFSGMPSDTAGPVVDRVRPMRSCAAAGSAAARPSTRAATRAVRRAACKGRVSIVVGVMVVGDAPDSGRPGGAGHDGRSADGRAALAGHAGRDPVYRRQPFGGFR